MNKPLTLPEYLKVYAASGVHLTIGPDTLEQIAEGLTLGQDMVEINGELSDCLEDINDARRYVTCWLAASLGANITLGALILWLTL